jgi:phosphoribosyl 1,2-cyclic phosphodiesterase/ActR/RegA family two-component response regulator
MPTVLLIEDDAESRRATAELFLREEWKTLEAGDGEAGIKLALEHRPDLALCDLLMPKVDGFTVCRRIREQLPNTKIIIVSGRDYGVDRKSAMDAGADEYLVKPISWEILHEAINRNLPPSAGETWRTSPVPEFTPPSTKIRFWGVRGSIPVPGSSTVGYGGNTACVEVRADGEIIILDAGSGIRLLGDSLEEEFGTRPIRLTLLITHSHWDHIQGLYFFRPAYLEKNSLRILCYGGVAKRLAWLLKGGSEGQMEMETAFFPVSLLMRETLEHNPSTITIEELKDMDFSIGKVQVHAQYVRHPGLCVGYRLETTNGSIAYLPDNEPYDVLNSLPEKRQFAIEMRKKLVAFLRDVDVLILDSQYTDEEYAQKVNWGHGSVSSTVALALDARARKLFLFHHDPNHNDEDLDDIVEKARMLILESGRSLEVEAAREGTEVWLGAKPTF